MPYTVWMTRNRRLEIPRVEPNTTDQKREKKPTKINEMITNDLTILTDWCLAQSSSERLPSIIDGG